MRRSNTLAIVLLSIVMLCFSVLAAFAIVAIIYTMLLNILDCGYTTGWTVLILAVCLMYLCAYVLGMKHLVAYTGELISNNY